MITEAAIATSMLVSYIATAIASAVSVVATVHEGLKSTKASNVRVRFNAIKQAITKAINEGSIDTNQLLQDIAEGKSAKVANQLYSNPTVNVSLKNYISKADLIKQLSNEYSKNTAALQQIQSKVEDVVSNTYNQNLIQLHKTDESRSGLESNANELIQANKAISSQINEAKSDLTSGAAYSFNSGKTNMAGIQQNIEGGIK